MTFTPKQIAKLRALGDAATPGRWTANEPSSIGDTYIYDRNVRDIAKTFGPNAREDAELIAKMRTALPEALAEIEKMQAALAEANVRAERWRNIAERADMCMTCEGGTKLIDPACGCADCLNTGFREGRSLPELEAVEAALQSARAEMRERCVSLVSAKAHYADKSELHQRREYRDYSTGYNDALDEVLEELRVLPDTPNSPPTTLALVAEICRLRENVAALVAAINWATGAGGSDFGENLPPDAKPYWWRVELIKRAGLTYDREAGVYALAEVKDRQS